MDAIIELYFGAEESENLKFITKREVKLATNGFLLFPMLARIPHSHPFAPSLLSPSRFSKPVNEEGAESPEAKTPQGEPEKLENSKPPTEIGELNELDAELLELSI